MASADGIAEFVVSLEDPSKFLVAEFIIVATVDARTTVYPGFLPTQITHTHTHTHAHAHTHARTHTRKCTNTCKLNRGGVPQRVDIWLA